ncbi:hypothetical protein [uncultured Robinsoniella sp.]
MEKNNNTQKWGGKTPGFDIIFDRNVQSDDSRGKNKEKILTMHKR